MHSSPMWVIGRGMILAVHELWRLVEDLAGGRNKVLVGLVELARPEEGDAVTVLEGELDAEVRF